jgi:hypothetical protein
VLKKLRPLLGLFVVAAACVLVLFTSGEASKDPVAPPIISLSHPKASATPQRHSRRGSHTTPPRFASLARVASASTAADAKSAVAATRRELLKHPDGSAAAAALLDFLEQGHDTSLQTPMQVGAGGELKEAPTTRVAIMDLLGELDSEQAAEYSRQVLESSASSDEWAIALRNYAWGVDNAASDPFLRAKVLELLTNPSWIAAPTAGFLEAFDFVPYTHDPTLVEPLVKLTKDAQSSSVRRSAFLALERFVSQDTTLGLRAVAQAEETQSFSPIRADTMARADLTQPYEVQIVQEYLLSSGINSQEFQLFATMFPHGGQFAGHSLATTFQPKPLSELARRDAQALRVVVSWLSNPALAERHQTLSQIYDRLVRLNESAIKGGYL